MPCAACPFACSEESEIAQNLGCLPAPCEILQMGRATGRAWGCHENETRPCAGFVAAAAQHGVLTDWEAALLSYAGWYRDGVP